MTLLAVEPALRRRKVLHAAKVARKAGEVHGCAVQLEMEFRSLASQVVLLHSLLEERDEGVAVWARRGLLSRGQEVRDGGTSLHDVAVHKFGITEVGWRRVGAAVRSGAAAALAAPQHCVQLVVGDWNSLSPGDVRRSFLDPMAEVSRPAGRRPGEAAATRVLAEV